MQSDVKSQKDKDIAKFIEVLNSMPNWFDRNVFSVEDIVRSGIVKAYIKAKYLIHDDGY